MPASQARGSTCCWNVERADRVGSAWTDRFRIGLRPALRVSSGLATSDRLASGPIRRRTRFIPRRAAPVAAGSRSRSAARRPPRNCGWRACSMNSVWRRMPTPHTASWPARSHALPSIAASVPNDSSTSGAKRDCSPRRSRRGTAGVTSTSRSTGSVRTTSRRTSRTWSWDRRALPFSGTTGLRSTSVDSGWKSFEPTTTRSIGFCRCARRPPATDRASTRSEFPPVTSWSCCTATWFIIWRRSIAASSGRAALEVASGFGGEYRLPHAATPQPMRGGSQFGSRGYSLLSRSSHHGMLAAANTEYVCLYGRREFLVLDAETGEVRWKCSNVPQHTTVFGNEDVVYMVPPDRSNAAAFRAADGKRLEVEKLGDLLVTAVAVTARGLVTVDGASGGHSGDLEAAANRRAIDRPGFATRILEDRVSRRDQALAAGRHAHPGDLRHRGNRARRPGQRRGVLKFPGRKYPPASKRRAHAR